MVSRFDVGCKFRNSRNIPLFPEAKRSRTAAASFLTIPNHSYPSTEEKAGKSPSSFSLNRQICLTAVLRAIWAAVPPRLRQSTTSPEAIVLTSACTLTSVCQLGKGEHNGREKGKRRGRGEHTIWVKFFDCFYPWS